MAQNEIVTPDFGGSAEVTVIEILVKAGDSLQADTSVVTLESDKATMDIPAGIEGTVKSIAVKVGDKVTTGKVLVMVESGANESATPQEKPKTETPKTEKPVAEKTQILTQEEDADEEDDEIDEIATSSDVHAGPGVRRMARELGVDLEKLTGTGNKSRILKEDVQKYVKQKLTSNDNSGNGFSLPPVTLPDFAQFGTISSKPLSRIQKISGKFLHRNWVSIPHVTQFGEADITDLERFRKAQKTEMDQQAVKLTPLVFVMKAVVTALKNFPNFNASLDATSENLLVKHYFHIGVAVDTPDGLVVPVIRDVDQKGLITLAKELAEVSEKARNKQLTPKDMQGGCFSISSLGGIGGTAFTPIINFPEVAILGVSKASFKPIYENNDFVPRLMLPLSLSYDHRVIDGAEGARFMVYLTQVLSDIRHLLMS